MERFENLPTTLRKILDKANISQNFIGLSDSQVYLIRNVDGEPNCYLKTGPAGTLEQEKNILEWLAARIPVPKVIHYISDEKDYLLTAEIKGVDITKAMNYLSPEKIVSILAQGLRLIHSIDTKGCPFDERIDAKLRKARENIDKGIVNGIDFELENISRTAEEIYSDLLVKKPYTEDLVFTHGDYCLPNIIVKEDKLSGFIDMGRAGIADRYQDIALAVRSIRHNLQSEEPVNLFLRKYGLKDVDFFKIDYYILLDELF
jgi:aminoglycoside phosphotransferase